MWHPMGLIDVQHAMQIPAIEKKHPFWSCELLLDFSFKATTLFLLCVV